MPPQRLIPLEPVGGEPELPPAFTDVVMALYVDGLPHDLRETEDEVLYAAAPLRDAASVVFALGCALAIERPEHIHPLLRQTHDDVDEILDECREPLAQQVAEARTSGEEVTAALFLTDLFTPLPPDDPVEEDVAHNVISIAFEYGCILATVERPAAMVVRNAHNRMRASEPDPFAPGPDPEKPLQELAAELATAYEQDFGFDS